MSSPTTAIEPTPDRTALERLFAIRIAINWEIAAYVAIIGLAFAFRFWDLGARALHHDESIHAQWSWRLAQGDYTHSPVFHGPFYYHVQGLVFLVGGASDYTSRVSAAIFGVALVMLPLLFRRWLGPVGTLAAVAFIAFSPTIVYYSRFFREDIYMAFFTLLMVAAMWRYMVSRRDRWLLVFALAYTGSITTKEATYLTVAVFLLYINGQLAVDLARKTLAGRDTDTLMRRSLLAAGIFPYAWAIAALWPFIGGIRKRAGWDEMPASGDVLVVMGTLTVPLLLRFAKPMFESPPLGLWPALPDGRWDWNNVCQGALPTSARDAQALGGLFILGCGAAAFVGLNWRAKTWAYCAGASAVVYLTLMTSFWTNLDGACTGPWGSIDYWVGQHNEVRGDQPWFYYFMLMPAYEFLPLVLAVGGAYWAVVKGNAFSRFLVFWLVGVFGALSWAGEKMPWLNVHIALPACILAAWTVHYAWTSWANRPDPRQQSFTLTSIAAIAMGALAIIAFMPGGPIAAGIRLLVLAAAVAFIVIAARPFGRQAVGTVVVVAVIGALSLFSMRTMLMAVFERGDDPKDLLIYTQSAPQITEVADQIDALAAATGKGFDLRIAVDSADSFSWPWAWYLRDYKGASYLDFSSGVPAGEWDVLLVNQSNASRVNDFVSSAGAPTFGSPIRYPHRWWFDETYKSAMSVDGGRTSCTAETGNCGPFRPATWGRVWEGISQEGWLTTWAEYWRDHDPHRTNGSVDAFAYFPATFNLETGELSFRPLEPPKPGVDSEGRPTIGGFGTLPGQFLAPADVEVDAAGNVFVIDYSTRKLQKFDATGNFVAAVDVREDPANAAESAEPWGLEILADGRVVIADTFGWRVRIFSMELEPLLSFGQAPANTPPGPLELFGPRDVAVDADGNLWVTDTGHDRIQVFTDEGEFVRTIGTEGAGDGQFDEPVGIDIAPDGRVYVADMYNGRVVVLSTEADFVAAFPVSGWGGQDATDKPYIEVLRDGRIALSVPALNEVRVYSADGNAEVTITGGEEPLQRPYGIVEIADGRLWVSEGAAGRLRLFEIR